MMATLAQAPRPYRPPPPRAPEDILAFMSLSLEEVEHYAAQHVPAWEAPDAPDLDDTWRDRNPELDVDVTWSETPVPRDQTLLDDDDFPTFAPRGVPMWRFVAAGIFAVLVGAALISTTRPTRAPTARTAAAVVVQPAKIPMPAIDPAATTAATGELEILPTPRALATHGAQQLAAKPKPKPNAVKTGTTSKAATTKGPKLKATF